VWNLPWLVPVSVKHSKMKSFWQAVSSTWPDRRSDCCEAYNALRLTAQEAGRWDERMSKAGIRPCLKISKTFAVLCNVPLAKMHEFLLLSVWARLGKVGYAWAIRPTAGAATVGMLTITAWKCVKMAQCRRQLVVDCSSSKVKVQSSAGRGQIRKRLSTSVFLARFQRDRPRRHPPTITCSTGADKQHHITPLTLLLRAVRQRSKAVWFSLTKTKTKTKNKSKRKSHWSKAMTPTIASDTQTRIKVFGPGHGF